MTAAFAIAAALVRKQKTGEGECIDVSLLDAGPRADPLVGGVHHFLQLFVGKNVFRDKTLHTGDGCANLHRLRTNRRSKRPIYWLSSYFFLNCNYATVVATLRAHTVLKRRRTAV